MKPGFFKNEELSKLPFEARLLFIGLWCLADREGRLENRPERIKIEVFPYDRINIAKLLDVITCNGFTLHYESNGKHYIQIINFKKHQFPHPHESKSIIPPCNDMSCNVNLNPSSLNPSSLNPYPPLPPGGGLMRFDDFWKTYPKRIGRKAAERHWHASVKTAVDVTDIRSALVNYLRSDDVRRGFMQNGSTWMNNWRDWVNYKGVEVPPAPKPPPKPPEVLPPDPTDDDLSEMHKQKVATMGPCRKACEMCETKGIKSEI